MREIKLIYNALAGQNKFSHSLDEIIGQFNKAGFKVSVYRISKGMNPETFVTDIKEDNTQAIVVAGGDGTINKIVNIIMKNKIKIPFGIIPAGTSNDFAKHMSIPFDFKEAVDKILSNNVQPIDVGFVNGNYFINVLSAGLFASTSYKTDKRLKDAFGQISYFLTAIKQPFMYKPFQIKIETDEYTIEEKTAVFAVFNGSSVGRIDKFSKESSVQDGKLDLVLLRDGKLVDYIKLVGEIDERNHLEDDNIVYLREPKFKISVLKGSCDRPDIDGDEGPDFPLNIECVSRRVKSLCINKRRIKHV